MLYERESEGISAAPAVPRPARLMDEVRRCLRLKHYSLRTEQAYTGWIRRFILANGKRHPREMGGPEVERFLSSLAVQGRVAASTQNQALSALLFLYRQVLAVDLPWLLASLLYGTGMRLMECLRLRVRDVDFACNEITVRAIPAMRNFLL